MDEVQLRTFDGQVAEASKRLADLERRMGTVSGSNDVLILEAIEELRKTLEELRAANEALRSQTEELDVARVLIECARLRYRDLLRALPDACLVTDHHGVIQEANSQAGALLGLSTVALRGRPFALHITAFQRKAFRAELAVLREAKTIQRLALRLRRRDETQIEVIARVRMLVRPGSNPELCWTLREVSPEDQARQLPALEAESAPQGDAARDAWASARSRQVDELVYPQNHPQLRIELFSGGLRLAGEADLYTAPLLSQALTAARSDGHSDLAIDLADLEFMDAQAIELLVDAAQQLPPPGKLQLVHPRKPIAKVLRLLRLGELANISVVYDQQDDQ